MALVWTQVKKYLDEGTTLWLQCPQMKQELLKLRVEWEEKRAFQDAADLAGVSLSAWSRERLRKAARIELEGAGQQIAFITRNREPQQ